MAGTNTMSHSDLELRWPVHTERGVDHAAVADALQTHGWAVVEGAFESGFVERLTGQVSPGAGNDAEAVEVRDALSDQRFLANTAISAVLVDVLGREQILGRLVRVPAASAEWQTFRERSRLFSQLLDGKLPTFGVGVLLLARGAGVRVWTGSHRIGQDNAHSQVVLLPRGACLLFDSRLRVELVENTGLALLAAYYRHWFRERRGALESAPVLISRTVYRQLPDAQRQLFVWRFDRYEKLRPRLMLTRALGLLPSPVLAAVQSMRRPPD